MPFLVLYVCVLFSRIHTLRMTMQTQSTNPFYTVLFVLLSCFLSQVSQAQTPVIISIFNESVALPSKQFLPTPIHLGIALGSEFTLKQRTWSSSVIALNLGYYFHKNLNQAVFLQASYGYEFRSSFGLSSAVNIGLGYLHVIRNQPEYKLENGQYVTAAGIGRPRFLLSPSIDVGYYVRPKEIKSGRIFIRYQPWVEYPFSPGFIPVLPHTNLHVGYKFYPFP